MTIVNPSILSGFMELLPEDQILFNGMKKILKNVLKNILIYQSIRLLLKKLKYCWQKVEEKHQNKFFISKAVLVIWR